MQLADGPETDDKEGYPGICVANIKPGGLAEGKLFPGDRILGV